MKELWYYMYKNTTCAKIIFDRRTEEVNVENYIDNILFLPFGVNKNPTWHDFELLMEDMVIPKTRGNLRECLELINVDHWDPYLIIKKTHGFMRATKTWVKFENEGDDVSYETFRKY